MLPFLIKAGTLTPSTFSVIYLLLLAEQLQQLGSLISGQGNFRTLSQLAEDIRIHSTCLGFEICLTLPSILTIGFGSLNVVIAEILVIATVCLVAADITDAVDDFRSLATSSIASISFVRMPTEEDLHLLLFLALLRLLTNLTIVSSLISSVLRLKGCCLFLMLCRWESRLRVTALSTD